MCPTIHPTTSGIWQYIVSDEIVRLRLENWRLAHLAAGIDYLDPNRSFTYFALRGALPAVRSEIQSIPDAEAVRNIRNNCLKIRELIHERLTLPAPLPEQLIRSHWFRGWERLRREPKVANLPNSP
jgi:hypothetical protein